jgi:hypothetical protein
MRRFLIVSSFVLAVATLFSVSQARADAIDNFTYQAGVNTFTWQLPSSPTMLSFVPGSNFAIPNVQYSENGTLQNPATFSFFSSFPFGFGGFQLPGLISATGPQLYTGPENAPTFITGTFALPDSFSATGNGILTIAAPEPSSLMLLGTGMLALLGFALKKAIVCRHNASNTIVA